MVKRISALLGIVLVVASTPTRAYTPGVGIAGTPHDWSWLNGTTLLLWADDSGNATTYNTGTPWIDPATNRQGRTTAAIGQCSTCHTSSPSGTGSLQWNYALKPITYRWNDTATTAGTRYPTLQADSYKGPSTKCLSCHDGLLAPIDGWFDRVGTAVASPGSRDAVSEGTNLSHTHPVAMPYPLNGMPSTYNFVRNGQLTAATEWVADPMASNGVRLYNDDGAGNIAVGAAPGRTGIECPSCHDVHNGSRVRDQMLLTGMLASVDRGPGGYLCAQCHRK